MSKIRISNCQRRLRRDSTKLPHPPYPQAGERTIYIDLDIMCGTLLNIARLKKNRQYVIIYIVLLQTSHHEVYLGRM